MFLCVFILFVVGDAHNSLFVCFIYEVHPGPVIYVDVVTTAYEYNEDQIFWLKQNEIAWICHIFFTKERKDMQCTTRQLTILQHKVGPSTRPAVFVFDTGFGRVEHFESVS